MLKFLLLLHLQYPYLNQDTWTTNYLRILGKITHGNKMSVDGLCYYERLTYTGSVARMDLKFTGLQNTCITEFLNNEV